MKQQEEIKRDFPLRLNLKGRKIVLRPLTTDDRPQMLEFAQDLEQDDLLFMQRDITQPGEVDRWIADDLEGRQSTLVACEGATIIGYATYELGRVRWTRHVAELRVVVTAAARGLGLGRLLLQLAFEMVLDLGVTKIIARVVPDQAAALRLFTCLGFEQEAMLRDHALGADGLTHDLLVLSFYPRQRQEQQCAHCGVPVLNALSVKGAWLCSQCYEAQYQELGGG